MNFAWRKWKLGLLVSVFLSFIVAGSGLAAGMKWQTFVSVFCTALLTHVVAFLKDHPVDSISFDEDSKSDSKSDAMKKIISLFLLASGLLVLALNLSACKKVTTSTVGPNGSTNIFTSYTMDPLVLSGITDVLSYGTKLGAQAGMAKSANVRPYLQAVEVELSSAVNSGAYDESTLTNALNKVSVNEIKDDAAVKEIIAHVQGLASMALSHAAQKGFAKADFLQPMLAAVDTGLRAALASN